MASKKVTKMFKKSINKSSRAMGWVFQTLSKTQKKLSGKTERGRAGKNKFFWKVAFAKSPKNENAIAVFCISVGFQKNLQKNDFARGSSRKAEFEEKKSEIISIC